jgi:hypothetical protein
MRRLFIAMLFAGLGCGAVSPVAQPAPSAELCVGSKPGCFTTIQAALDAAQDGDTVKIGKGTFAGGITIEKSVQLVGVSAGATTIKGGGPVVTIGQFGSATQPTVTISRVTITGGFASSEGVAAGGGVKIEFAGPGVAGATVTISDSVVAGNRASPSGLFPPGGFCGPVPCAVAWGGGIDNSGTLTLTSSRVSDNVAGAELGGSSDATIAQGGGIRNHPDSTLTLRHCVVTGNRAAVTAPNGQNTDGGGIADQGVLTIEDSAVTGNKSEVSSSIPSAFPFDIQQEANAGGIFSSGSARITRSVISDNSVRSSNSAGDALALVGGIDGDDEGMLDVTGSTIARNRVTASVPPESGSSAVAGVGGISTRGVSTVSNVLVTGNAVDADSAAGFVLAVGGGLGNIGQTTLRHALVIGNSVTADGAFGAAQGGGVNNVSLGGPDPQLTLSDSAVTANMLVAGPGIDAQGGGIFTAFPVTLIRTLVAGNKPDQCFGC